MLKLPAIEMHQGPERLFITMNAPELNAIAKGLKAMWWLTRHEAHIALKILLANSEWTLEEQGWAGEYIARQFPIKPRRLFK